MSYLEGLVAGSLGVVWDLTECCPNSPELTNMHVESIHLMTAISKAEELGLLGAPEGRLENSRGRKPPVLVEKKEPWKGERVDVFRPVRAPDVRLFPGGLRPRLFSARPFGTHILSLNIMATSNLDKPGNGPGGFVHLPASDFDDLHKQF